MQISDGKNQDNIQVKYHYSEPELQVSALQFYVRDNRPTKNVCPFADPRRYNPCPKYGQHQARKDTIMKHLRKIREQGGDPHHQIDDPLWKSYSVKWFLTSKPPKLDPQTRQAGIKASQLRYDKKRRTGNHESMERPFQVNEGRHVAEVEYRKFWPREEGGGFIVSSRSQLDLETQKGKEVGSQSHHYLSPTQWFSR